MADRILPVGNGGVLGSSKSMSKMRVNPYRDRAKSFYQRYVIKGKLRAESIDAVESGERASTSKLRPSNSTGRSALLWDLTRDILVKHYHLSSKV